MSDIVVAYCSRTGKTKHAAETLAELLGADVEEIREAKSRDGVLGFLGASKDALLGKAVELTSTHCLDGRRAVVLATPVWAGTATPAMFAYLRSVDVASVAVFAMCTYDGGAGKTFYRLEQVLPAGLRATLGLKKPDKDPQRDEKLRAFAERIRGALAAE
ncbi:MAG: flavodoxin [Phycisphaerae bacterium]|nr:flavodoxin [Phycisphaerae bacterium]